MRETFYEAAPGSSRVRASDALQFASPVSFWRLKKNPKKLQFRGHAPSGGSTFSRCFVAMRCALFRVDARGRALSGPLEERSLSVCECTRACGGNTREGCTLKMKFGFETGWEQYLNSSLCAMCKIGLLIYRVANEERFQCCFAFGIRGAGCVLL